MPFLLPAIALLEIAVFIIVGGEIGVWLTLLLTLISAVAGTYLLRRQGLGVLMRIRDDVNAGRMPAAAMAEGVLIVVAGILLLTPGFVTDIAGLLLFIPAFRDWAWHSLGPIFFARLGGRWARWPGAREGGGSYHTVIDVDGGPSNDDSPDRGH